MNDLLLNIDTTQIQLFKTIRYKIYLIRFNFLKHGEHFCKPLQIDMEMHGATNITVFLNILNN